MRIPLLTALLALPLASSALATRYYVDADAAPGGDGLAWASAFDSLDDALEIITSGDRIWLAEGTYVPSIRRNAKQPRSVTFYIPAGVHIHGGFDGTEMTFGQRAGLFSTTILDGELGAPGPHDNAWHVVNVEHPSGIPPGGNRLTGMVIQNGNALDADGKSNGQGGGVLSFNVALRLQDVQVRHNAARNGAGVHAQPASLTLIDTWIHHNRALNNGGGLWGQAINIKAFNTRISHNSAGARGGGAYMHSMAGFEAVLYAGCVFHDNFAERGGGIFVGGGEFASGAAVLRNCTFAYNSASVRGGGIQANTAPTFHARVWLYNSIVWANRAPIDASPGAGGRMIVEHSNVQDVYYSPTFGNMSTDPLFVDAAARDLRLLSGSPSVDSGSNELIARDQKDLDGDGDFQEPMPFDIDGEARRSDDPGTPDTGTGSAPIVDMGAYEVQGV
ncbi:MAG: hypothetical protein GY711_33420 [bacterium]|nr:hypothetical protein [bacterium]